VEAAALAKPILFGPGMGNFRSIARDLLARGAAGQVVDAPGLGAALANLLGDPVRRAEMAAAGAQWRQDNVGAVARTVAVIEAELAALRA
jgi:3-deoxy-D-manno-octulosonic-acid transferase